MTYDVYYVYIKVDPETGFSMLSNLCIDGRKKSNGMLPNPLWIISIEDYGLWKFIGNFMFSEGLFKGNMFSSALYIKLGGLYTFQ